MNLASINEKIASCTLCALSQSRTLAVPGEGPSDAKIMLIGEAPGREEDLSGRPFVGRAGKLLDECLREAGIARREIFITSVIKCRPPNNRKPSRAEIRACGMYLREQIDLINPDVIGLLGNVAASAILGRQGITALRGKFFEDRFLVTFHPAAIVRNKNLKSDFISDLIKIRESAEQ
jgi:DNA polymerase